MTTLASQLGLAEEVVECHDLLAGPVLPEAKVLLDQAFKVGPTDPQGGQVLLAAAMLGQARRTPEGRLAAALALLAPLVVHQADPYMTLGPKGAEIRVQAMPAGWAATIQSWNRLRYAWWNGLPEILGLPKPFGATATGAGETPVSTGPAPAGVLVRALDEVMRLSAAEPEPVSVIVREVWPGPKIAFGVTLAALGLAAWNVFDRFRHRKRR